MKNLFLGAAIVAASILTINSAEAQQITGSSLFSPSVGGARILSAVGNTAANPAIGFQNTVSTTATAQNDLSGGNGIFRPLANTMAFSTSSTERMRITSGGFLGIGTANPTNNLHVLGAANPAIKLSSSSSSLVMGIPTAAGNYSPFAAAGDIVFKPEGNVGQFIFSTNATFGSGRRIVFESTTAQIMKIHDNGKVQIGNVTTPGDYKLYVQTGILAEKVKVASSTNPITWADYVFASDYQLKPLSEVEAFVKANKHLPNIPSAATVAKEGLDMAEMFAKQMEKIEELTLYIIEQNKKTEAQNKQIEQLQTRISELEKQ